MKSIGRFLSALMLGAVLAACNSSGSSPPVQLASDTTPPVITLVGANPQIIAVGEAYVELGATATDNVDGDLTSSLVIDSSAVDQAAIGDYEVTYDVSDAAGNAAETVTRTVIVQPPAPDIELTHNRMPFTTPGTAVQLSWNSSDTSTCTASGGWSGPRDTAGSENIGELWETTTFSLTCTGDGGSTTVSTTVSVAGRPRRVLRQLHLVSCPARLRPLHGAAFTPIPVPLLGTGAIR